MNPSELLKYRQSLHLELKIELTKKRIREWYYHYDGMVYVSFSGGKDSTVLLDLVRLVFPDVPAVFVDTGLEFPEIRDFVKTIDNVVWLKPKKSFRKIIEEHGYPVISRNVSTAISRYRNTKDPVQKQLRKYGGINPTSGKVQTVGTIPKKYHRFIDAPFKISEYCCYALKKQPFNRYKKETGRHPFVGTMASDSHNRKLQVIKSGCNQFEGGTPQSKPMSFWMETDIWESIKSKNLKYSIIYDMGYDRTGCMFCMFGVHLESRPNRFQRMNITHPKQWNYCINTLGLGKILDFMGVPYTKESHKGIIF